MKQCKDCVHFKYVNKGLMDNYAGCEKCTTGMTDRFTCDNYKKR